MTKEERKAKALERVLWVTWLIPNEDAKDLLADLADVFESGYAAGIAAADDLEKVK